MKIIYLIYSLATFLLIGCYENIDKISCFHWFLAILMLTVLKLRQYHACAGHSIGRVPFRRRFRVGAGGGDCAPAAHKDGMVSFVGETLTNISEPRPDCGFSGSI